MSSPMPDVMNSSASRAADARTTSSRVAARHWLFAALLTWSGTMVVAAEPPAAPTTVAAAPGVVTVTPTQLRLVHPRQPWSLVVSTRTPSGFHVDQAPTATFTSSNEAVAKVVAPGWVWPVGNGSAEISIAAAGQTFKVPVMVELPAQEPSYSFRHEVMPVFSKTGCNLGACHGYSLGKNGFKLSLRGQEPDQDWSAVVKDSLGRRVDTTNSATSLLITKPLGVVAHQGGVRFQRGSLPHEILDRWIAQGAPQDLSDVREVVAVKVVPDKLVLSPNSQHRLQLVAHYSDGSTRDVTRLANFSANNDLYATVSDDGQVTAREFGETAIVARFERKFAAVDVIVLRDDPAFQPTPVPTDHFIDTHVVRKLNELKIQPSAPADDEQFLRRVSLDLIGLQPTADEVKAFLADTDAQKRTKAVDRLLERPEFVDHWSLKWGDLLQNSRNVLSPSGVFLFREWIRAAVAGNMPLDQFARELLVASGPVTDSPAAGYLAISKDVNDSVERVTQVFCGVRMLCARCHSHPLENWTQADYYGVASFFNQVTTKNDPRQPNVPNSRVVLVNRSAGLATNPRTGRPQAPRFLGGGELPDSAPPGSPPQTDRREVYARWLTSAENPYFARGLVNRVWSYFFHRGIVEPVDDVRSTNPPINPELLASLSQDFVDHKFDAKHLMRTIVLSRTYQASSAPTPSNRHDEQNFSHAIPRRVPAEALLDSLVQATGVKENFGGAPGGFTAAQLPDANVTSDFLALFGKPQRMEACECERDGGSNMLQALHLINGQAVLGKVANPGGRVATLVKQQADDRQLVTELYLWTVARHPRPAELDRGVEFLKSAGAERATAAQDLAWALLNSRDFMLIQ